MQCCWTGSPNSTTNHTSSPFMELFSKDIRMSPYSKIDWMKDFNIISKVLLSRRNIKCASISTRRPARFIQSSIWLLHERLLEKITLRCLCAVTSFITDGPNVIGGGGSFLFFWWDKQRFCFRWAKWNQLLFCPFIYGSQIAINVVGSFNLIIKINKQSCIICE